MAQRIVSSSDYTFDASLQTITFGAAYTGLELQHIELIHNLSDAGDGRIYQFNKAGYKGTLAGLVLTLDFDTTAMNDADDLMIIVAAEFLSDTVLLNEPISIDDNGGSITVDGVFWQATQPISAAALPLPAGAATSANQQTDALTDTELRASPVDVDTGLVQSLTDTELRATPVPISGTIVADAGTNLNTSALALEATLQSIKTAVEIIDNSISGSETQVDVLTMPVVTVTHGKTLKTVTGTVSVDTDIVAAVPTKRIKVVSYALFTASTTLNVITFQSDASTALWTVPLQTAANLIFGANLSIPAPSFLFATVAGEKLTLDVSSANNVTYSVTYFDDDIA